MLSTGISRRRIFPPGLGDIRPKQRLPAGQDHRKIPRSMVRRNRIQRPQEILQGHILLPALHRTVAPAMTTAEHAAGRAFPEEVIQFVDLRLIGAEQAEQQRIHGAGMVFRQIYVTSAACSPWARSRASSPPSTANWASSTNNPDFLIENGRITDISGGIYPDRAAQQQTPEVSVILPTLQIFFCQ